MDKLMYIIIMNIEKKKKGFIKLNWKSKWVKKLISFNFINRRKPRRTCRGRIHFLLIKKPSNNQIYLIMGIFSILLNKNCLVYSMLICKQTVYKNEQKRNANLWRLIMEDFNPLWVRISYFLRCIQNE